MEQTWDDETIREALEAKGYKESYVRICIRSDFIRWIEIKGLDIKLLDNPEVYKRWVLKDTEDNIIFVGRKMEACKHANLFSFRLNF